MFSHILFATDFSDQARRALPFALELARRSGSRVTLFHAIEESYHFATFVEDMKESARRQVKNLLQELIKESLERDGCGELDLDSLIYSGRPAHGILEAADDLEADLVVMGTRGAGGLERLFMGSVTAETVLHARVPVLAVPENCSYRGLDHLVFATDYREGDLKVLDRLTRLSELFDSKLSVVHVAEHQSLDSEIRLRGFRELAGEQVPSRGVERSYYPLFAKDLYAGLAEYLSEEHAQLLALVRYRKSLLHTLIEKNHVKKLELSTRIPLLVLPGDPEPWKGNLEF